MVFGSFWGISVVARELELALALCRRRKALLVIAKLDGTLWGWRPHGEGYRGRLPVFLVVDTCVWLDLAKDYSQQALLAALEELVRIRQVSLVVPQLVTDEFKRNRDRVVEDAGRSIGGTMRRAKELLAAPASRHREVLLQ